MPRKPSHPSIVRDLRQSLGLTQAQLAKRLILSTVAIKKIEGGKLQPSRRVAMALGRLTGVNYEDILPKVKERTNVFKCFGCCASDYLETDDWRVFSCPKCGWQLKLIESLNLFPPHEGKSVKPQLSMSEFIKGHRGHT